MVKKIKVAILGATGMVGQRFISLLENHPWFEVAVLAASPQSAGKTYSEAVSGRWLISRSGTSDPAKRDLGAINNFIPEKFCSFRVKSVEEDFDEIVKEADLVFSAIDADKEKIKEIEERYAAAGVAVVSNNSAHRWTEDVPMLIPEINARHLFMINEQRKNRGWLKHPSVDGCSPDSAKRNLGKKGGFIVVKPNCSLQSYLPVVYALKEFGPKFVSVTTLQAISGAGKTFETWPEMADNCIPFIKGEEEKTEKEPLKIWGSGCPAISATCIRVPASDGHMASAAVKFKKKPTLEQIIDALENFKNPLAGLDLPSAPKQFIKYFFDDDRPQTKLDRDYANGMGITCGRFREDGIDGWKFVALSHNTIRGAAGGAVLIAELLYKKGYLINNEQAFYAF